MGKGGRLMTDRVLRDHSEPCDHPQAFKGTTGKSEYWLCVVCPGGWEVTDDHIRRMALDLADHNGSEAERAALASALGLEV